MQKKQNNVGYIVLFAVMGIAVSCQKDIPSAYTNTVPQNFSQVFEAFWNNMNTNYVYWDIDTTHWDAMYRQYQPVFAQLNLQDPQDLKKSIDYFRQMTDGLIDSHYSISFLPKPIVDSQVFPAADRKKRDAHFHSPFLYISIDSNYLDPGFVSGKYTSTAHTLVTAVSGTIHSNILYFYCSGFALREAYTSNSANGVKGVLQHFFDQLKNRSPNTKGLIIDVRSNNGGNVEDLDFLVGQLTAQPIPFGFVRYKANNGRLAYTPWMAVTIPPQPGAQALNLPVVVLADNYSISLAEALTMAIKTLPNSSFVGETTWGATGPITANAVYNDGPFTIPGFLSVYTSSAVFQYRDGKIYEGKGFPPDIAIPFNLTTLYSGDDPSLDSAIMLIH